MKKKVRHGKILACCGMPRHAAACFKTPTNSSQNLALRHAAACCGMLLPLVLVHGENFAVKKSGEVFPPAKFSRRVTNNFTANSDAREYCEFIHVQRWYQAEGRNKDVLISNMK